MRIQSLLVAVLLFFTGCLTPKAQENPKTTDELRTVLQDFHMKLRWSLWEQAAAYTSPDFRNEFLGRYEELGEDFKIVDLEVKSVTIDDPISIVDVEQQWYQEPDMVVQKKRYIESWVLLGGNWRIIERIPRDEWRERQTKTPEETPQAEPEVEPAKHDPADPRAAAKPE